MNDNWILCLGGKGSAPSDQVDEDSGDQEETQQNDRGKPDAQYTNGYGRGSRGGRGRGFRGYRPRYIRRGGFRAQKPGGNPEVIKFFDYVFSFGLVINNQVIQLKHPTFAPLFSFLRRMLDLLKELQEEEAGEEDLEVDLEEASPEAVVVSAEVEVSDE